MLGILRRQVERSRASVCTVNVACAPGFLYSPTQVCIEPGKTRLFERINQIEIRRGRRVVSCKLSTGFLPIFDRNAFSLKSIGSVDRTDSNTPLIARQHSRQRKIRVVADRENIGARPTRLRDLLPLRRVPFAQACRFARCRAWRPNRPTRLYKDRAVKVCASAASSAACKFVPPRRAAARRKSSAFSIASGVAATGAGEYGATLSL